jgi:hypothetical protein
MVNFLSSLLLALIVLIIVLIATFVVALGFLVIGGVLANWFSLTRLEATAVTLVVGILLTYLIVRILEIPMPFATVDDDWDDEEDVELPPLPRPARRGARRKR